MLQMQGGMYGSGGEKGGSVKKFYWCIICGIRCLHYAHFYENKCYHLVCVECGNATVAGKEFVDGEDSGH